MQTKQYEKTNLQAHYWVCFVLITCCWVWGLPISVAYRASETAVGENWFSFFVSSCQLEITSCQGMGDCAPLPLSALSPHLAWAYAAILDFYSDYPIVSSIELWEIWIGETLQEPPFSHTSMWASHHSIFSQPSRFLFVLFGRRIIYFYINMWGFYFSHYLTRKDVKGQFEGEFLNKTQSWRCRVVVQHLTSTCQALGLTPNFKMEAKAKSFPPKQENWGKKTKQGTKSNIYT